MNPSRRAAIGLAVAMGATSLLAGLTRPRPLEPGARSIDLDKIFPSKLGPWRLDEAMQAFVRPAAVQGKRQLVYDQVLERAFIGPNGERVMLSIAFGAEQSAGLQLHRPEICYKAGGYLVGDTRSAVLTLADRSVPVTRLRAELPGRPEPITYWTLLGGEVVADASSFRLRRLSFAARRQLVEGMLVRVSSIDPDTEAAYEVHRRFAEDMARALPAAERARFIGV